MKPIVVPSSDVIYGTALNITHLCRILFSVEQYPAYSALVQIF